jgi:hypothetical protein
MEAGALREAGQPVLNVQTETPVVCVPEMAIISTHVMVDEVAPVVPGIAVDVGEEMGAVAPAIALLEIKEEEETAAAATGQVVTPYEVSAP